MQCAMQLDRLPVPIIAQYAMQSMSFAEAGAVIKQARRDAKLSQAELAARLRMSRTTISQVESGTIPELGVRKYVAICEALGLAFAVAPRTAPSWAELQLLNAQRAAEAARLTDQAIADAFSPKRRQRP